MKYDEALDILSQVQSKKEKSIQIIRAEQQCAIFHKMNGQRTVS